MKIRPFQSFQFLIFALLTLCVIHSQGPLAQDSVLDSTPIQDPNIDPNLEPPQDIDQGEPWPDLFLQRLSEGLDETWDDAGLRLSSSLFESLTDREIFETKLFGEVNLSVDVVRKVFNNQDILDTFTVIDIMNVPLTLPIPLVNSEIGGSNGTFSLALGLKVGSRALHIRQVGPKAVKNLKTTQEIKKLLGQASELSDNLILTSDSPSTPDQSPDLSAYAFWQTRKPIVRARYNKIWNLLTHPLGLPLTAQKMREKSTGEIFSYSLDGTIQLGASVGWSNFQLAGLDLSRTRASAGITTYLKGRYQVSLWKEDPKTAQVKLTRVRQKGINLALGQAELEHTLFEGVVVLDKKVFEVKESFIPFSINMNTSHTKQFDIGYRFDLSNAQARLAYNKAVLGRFKLASELVDQKGSGVSSAFERQSTTVSNGKYQNLKLSILFEKKSGQVRSNARAVITMDGKESLLFKSTSASFKNFDTLWGAYEKRSHQFTTTLNASEATSNGLKPFSMRIEGRVEDSSTTAKELSQIREEIEIITGRKDIFPPLPKHEPKIDCHKARLSTSLDFSREYCDDLEKAQSSNYGPTSFFYQVNLTRKQLEKIKNTNVEKMWRVLELAFGVKKGSWKNPTSRFFSGILNSYATLINIPLAIFQINLQAGGRLIIAKRFFRAWKKLKKIIEPQEMVKAFGKLFKTVHYSPQLVKTLGLLRGPDESRYFVIAKASRLWGQFSVGGENLGEVQPIDVEARRRIEFDRIAPRTNVDQRAKITNFSLEKIDADKVRLRFNLASEPELVYLRIDKSPAWGKFKNILRLILGKAAGLKKGQNELVISRYDELGFKRKLARALFNGSTSTLMLAYSIDGERFGAVNAKRFKLDSL